MFTTSEKRAVQQLSTRDGALAVVAADQRVSLRGMFERAGRPSDLAALRAFKRALVAALAAAASALLLDPEIALPAVVDAGLVPADVGLLVSVEVSGARRDGGLSPAQLLPEFGAAGVRRMGGTAAKLLVRMRADREDASGHNAAVVRQVVRDCAEHDLLAVVEGLVFPLPDETDERFRRLRPDLIRDGAVLLEECGAKYLKLEYPGSEAACRGISEAIAVPWALLSAGVDHPTFVEQLRTARASGASGFIAGRSIWKEAAGLPAPDRDAFLAGEGRRRLEELLGLL
ncbi:MAG: tagatose-bisphosphate aldolase [Gaiellales bacterium]